LKRKAPTSRQTPVKKKSGFRTPWQERPARVTIPERVSIAKVVEAEPGITYGMLAKRLGIDKIEAEAMSRRVDAMLRDGELVMKAGGRFHPGREPQTETGVVSRHRDGFGFIAAHAGGDDLFVAPHSLEGIMHGDTVTFVRKGVDGRGRQEARIIGVTTRAVTRVVGKLQRQGTRWMVVPRDRNFPHPVEVAGNLDQSEDGTVVSATITTYPEGGAGATGRVDEVLGNENDSGIEIEIALRKYDLPHVFSKPCLAEAKGLPAELRKGDYSDRKDLRDLPLVTIDGEDARDFDDAVFCEVRASNSFRLVVAIADVSHYVIPGKPLDVDARERSTSIYFPRRVIPMLPEKLSNGLCSLNPEVDRLVMVCDMHVTGKGEIRSYEFYPGVMHSKARFTYTEVAAILADPKGEAAKKRKKLVGPLLALEQVYHALLAGRGERGAVDFESMESRIMFNEAGRIERIVPVVRNDAHKLIEECMLAANVCAADILEKNKHPALYRIHAGPTPAKLETLKEFLGGQGLFLGGGDDPQAKDYAKLAREVKGRPDALLISSVMLRSMQQAQYSPDNIGHFGLAYERYAHFTSPIRRYPDLLVHRAIKAVLKRRTYVEADWEALGIHCSKNERRADDASREVTSWLKCMYAREHLGSEFDGAISGVAGFGIFVTMDQLLIDGMIHVTELGRDYYRFDEARHVLRGERSGHTFKLGQRLRVKIVRADPDALKIDLQLVEALPEEAASIGTETPKPERSAKPPKSKPAKRGKPAKAAPKKSPPKPKAPKRRTVKAK
jgi:ribonuclease R